MDRFQYKKYLMEKYNFTDTAMMGSYIKIDIMSIFEEKIMVNEEILKGAFNLFKHFNYSRGTELTKDIDITIIDKSIDDYLLNIKESLISNKDDLYTYRITKITDLSIEVSGYKGKRINVEAIGLIRDSFHIDIAIEELDDVKGIKHSRDKKYYSIERTLADKYVTMIQRGSENTREKDFIDVSSLWSKSNFNLFMKITKDLISNREINHDTIKSFKDEFMKIEYITKHNLQDIIIQINKNI